MYDPLPVTPTPITLTLTSPNQHPHTPTHTAPPDPLILPCPSLPFPPSYPIKVFPTNGPTHFPFPFRAAFISAYSEGLIPFFFNFLISCSLNPCVEKSELVHRLLLLVLLPWLSAVLVVVVLSFLECGGSPPPSSEEEGW